LKISKINYTLYFYVGLDLFRQYLIGGLKAELDEICGIGSYMQ
jgi:hypothetical protein